MPAETCPQCGRPYHELSAEEVDAKLEQLEPVAVAVLEQQLTSKDERVAQAAATKLLEWRRGKPKQQVQQTTDQVTVIRYESAAWAPVIEHQPIKELPVGREA